MDDLDRRLLAFVGAHRFVLVSQIGSFLREDDVGVERRLAGLTASRLVRAERLAAGGERLVRVTDAGLRAISSRATPPGFDLAGYRHEVGVVWLWVAGWRGAFGDAERVLSTSEMRALDLASKEAGTGDARFAISVGGTARVYPDVLLVFAWGRVAVHLVSWPHRRIDLDELLGGHRARAEVCDIVLFLVDDQQIAGRVIAAAGHHGLSEKVRVQRVVGDGTAVPQARAALGSAG